MSAFNKSERKEFDYIDYVITVNFVAFLGCFISAPIAWAFFLVLFIAHKNAIKVDWKTTLFLFHSSQPWPQRQQDNVVHLQIGPRNKTVLNDQFGNNVFHAQIGTRNKTVLIYQFENTMFHSQLGTRNGMFLFYTRVNVLCLSCEKAGPLIVNRNTKTRNSRY